MNDKVAPLGLWDKFGCIYFTKSSPLQGFDIFDYTLIPLGCSYGNKVI